jgi:hypothetical protein
VTENICPLAHRNDPDRPRRATRGLLCEGHYRGLGDDLASLPGLHNTLGAYLVRTGNGDGTRTGVDVGINLDGEVVKAREHIANLLTSWARIVLEEGTWTIAPADTPYAVACWLGARLPWIAAQAWADEFADNIHTTTREARAQVQPNTTYRIELGPCPELLAIVDDAGPRLDPCKGTVIAVMRRATSRELLPSFVACTDHGEDDDQPHVWGPAQWHALGRRMGRSDHADAVEAFLRSVAG